MPESQLDDLDEGQPALKCDIEIDNKVGKTEQDILVSTAEALRSVAAQIETGKLDTGFHPIKAPNGQVIGQVYLDHYASL